MGSSVLVLKLSAAAAALALVAVVARLAPSRGVEPVRAAAFVGLNPLVLVHVVGGPHNDGLAMLLAMLAVAAALGAAEASGGARLRPRRGHQGFGRLRHALRPARDRRRHRRLLLGAAAAFALLALVAWPAFGPDWLGSLNVAGNNLGKTSHMSVPITFSRITGVDQGLAQYAALYIYGALFAYLLIWTWRGGDWVRAAGWAGAGLLLATTWLLPWYLIWALPSPPSPATAPCSSSSSPSPPSSSGPASRCDPGTRGRSALATISPARRQEPGDHHQLHSLKARLKASKRLSIASKRRSTESKRRSILRPRSLTLLLKSRAARRSTSLSPPP